MDIALPEFVVRRLRQSPPPNCTVVSCSTPVISFGNPATAKIATLGLNPSNREFLAGDGTELIDGHRRFETLKSLGVRGLKDAPDSGLRATVKGCNGYFQRRPYRPWFNVLEEILLNCGCSYYDGSACHLDLVQWATAEKWRKLPKSVRNDLLQSDVEFLLEQLQFSKIKALLMNGRAVAKLFSSATGVTLSAESAVLAGKEFTICGNGPRNLTIIGWSTNLQSSFGVTREFRQSLAEIVGKAVKRLGG